MKHSYRKYVIPCLIFIATHVVLGWVVMAFLPAERIALWSDVIDYNVAFCIICVGVSAALWLQTFLIVVRGHRDGSRELAGKLMGSQIISWIVAVILLGALRYMTTGISGGRGVIDMVIGMLDYDLCCLAVLSWSKNAT